MSNRSRKAARHTGNAMEPKSAPGNDPGFRGASSADSPPRFLSLAAPTCSLSGGASTPSTRRCVDVSGMSGHARFSPNACTAWAAAGAPFFAIDGRVVPPSDVASAAALYLGLHDPAPAGKQTTCTQEGGHVKASSKKIRAPSVRRDFGRDPNDS